MGKPAKQMISITAAAMIKHVLMQMAPVNVSTALVSWLHAIATIICMDKSAKQMISTIAAPMERHVLIRRAMDHAPMVNARLHRATAGTINIIKPVRLIQPAIAAVTEMIVQRNKKVERLIIILIY